MEPLAALAERIEQQFRLIAETRMQGVPILNPALGVAMRGLRLHEGYHAGILVTPWFMNLMLLPVDQSTHGRRVGVTSDIALPSGIYDAMWCHEEALGGYWSVSLFSPMQDFADMEGAVATADATLDLLFARDEAVDDNGWMEASVQPAAARGVEARIAEQAAEAERMATERLANEQLAAVREAERERSLEPDGEAVDNEQPDLRRRAMFGLRREGAGR